MSIECVYFNRDYTPYAIMRDKELFHQLHIINIPCKSYQDYYLQEPGTILVSNGKMYHKFTPFYEAMLKEKIATPILSLLDTFHGRFSKYDGKKLKNLDLLDNVQAARNYFLKTPNPQIAVHGGRKAGLERLKWSLKTQGKFDETRENMALESSRMSAYLKFGAISIREIYWAFVKKYNKNHGYIRELIWRDYFAHLLYAFPETLKHSYYERFDKINWKINHNALEKWKKGQTGFPFVDACMRELNTIGFMHNRGRMVVASFLIKTLLINWREGEKYFAQKLVDYDVASNVGNWQSVVGGGAYSMPYFRVMNPWIQSENHDKDAVYIKHWVPELADVPANHIHQWNIYYKDYPKIKYPQPMTDYAKQKELFLRAVENAK